MHVLPNGYNKGVPVEIKVTVGFWSLMVGKIPIKSSSIIPIETHFFQSVSEVILAEKSSALWFEAAVWSANIHQHCYRKCTRGFTRIIACSCKVIDVLASTLIFC